ncbi:MAG TPA: sialidase family protein [Streptosporangiaceae bacterium]|nr:sialidase family protein [Streptosporangiaceae bacterium]
MSIIGREDSTTRHGLPQHLPGRPARVNGSPWQRSQAVWDQAGVEWVPDLPAAARRWSVPKIAIPVAVLLLAAAGAYAARGPALHRHAAPTGAALAGGIFTADLAPAVLSGAAADGNTAVTIGTDQNRARFLSSVDGGRTWHVAPERASDGGEPAPGAVPARIAAGRGGWLALGGSAVWTSKDGRVWTRQPDATVFGPNDQVAALGRTASGFVAVGSTVWVTGLDGRSWQRLTLDGATLDRAATLGDIVVAHGTQRRTVTKNVTKRKVTTTVPAEAFWRSADGGRTWTPLPVPPTPATVAGAPVRVVTGPGGFYLVREVAGKHRSATVLTSADGSAWTVLGAIDQPDYAGLDKLAGGADGLSAVMRTAHNGTAVLHSADGRSWQRITELAPGRTVMGLAVLRSATIVAGNPGFLWGPSGDVDLAGIAGAVHPDRTVAALATGAGQILAVGSATGGAAAWATTTGRAWQRVQLPVAAGQRRLTALAYGPQGWAAIGQHGSLPLVMTSPSGGAWKAGTLPGPDGTIPYAITSTSSGYDVVGRSGAAAAAWHSADLRTWTRATGDLGGPSWMSGVAASGTGVVAVGGRLDHGSERPAVWTSSNGRKWTAPASVPLPAPLAAGSLTGLLTNGPVVVALGTGVVGQETYAFALTSGDGGRSWRPEVLAGRGAFTAATVTPHGFLAAGIAGAPGRTDVVVWTSADGLAWHRATPLGTGLDGPGAQRLTALTVVGNDLLAVGVTGDYRGDTPTLWHTRVP